MPSLGLGIAGYPGPQPTRSTRPGRATRNPAGRTSIGSLGPGVRTLTVKTLPVSEIVLSSYVLHHQSDKDKFGWTDGHKKQCSSFSSYISMNNRQELQRRHQFFRLMLAILALTFIYNQKYDYSTTEYS